MSFVTSAPAARIEEVLVETNSERAKRPVYWVARGLQNVLGLPWWSSYPEEANLHWGLRVGPYLWELAADKKNGGKIIKNCLPIAEWWEPSLGPELVGCVTMTDTYIDYCAQYVMDLMGQRYKDVFKKEYHITLNNCQIFVKVLDHLMQNDGELRGWWNEPPYSQVTWKWTRDEWDRAKRLPQAHPRMDSEASREIRAHELIPYQPHIGISGPWLSRRRKSSLRPRLPLALSDNLPKTTVDISISISESVSNHHEGHASESDVSINLHGTSISESLTRWSSDKTTVGSTLASSSSPSEMGTDRPLRTAAVTFQLPEFRKSPGRSSQSEPEPMDNVIDRTGNTMIDESP